MIETINGTIYKITNPIGKVYIGQTTRPVETRWNEYKTLKCESQPKIYNSLVYHGVENHTFEVVESAIKTQEELNEKEIFYIKSYNSYKNGLNCTIGGQGVRKPILKPFCFEIETGKKVKVTKADISKNPHAYEGVFLTSGLRNHLIRELFKESHNGMSFEEINTIKNTCAKKQVKAHIDYIFENHFDEIKSLTGNTFGFETVKRVLKRLQNGLPLDVWGLSRGMELSNIELERIAMIIIKLDGYFGISVTPSPTGRMFTSVTVTV